MAPPKKQGNLSKSAQYCRDNPEARKKKAQTDKKINARPEQRAKRSELKQARRDRGIDGNFDGRDLAHQSNGKLRLQSASKNRGDGETSAGDIKARGKK